MHGLRGVNRQPGDLEFEGRLVLDGPVDHHDVAPVRVGHEQQCEVQARERRAGAVRQVLQRWRRQAQRRDGFARYELLQRHTAVVRGERDALDLDLAPAFSGPSVERGLEVDVVKRRHRPRDDRMLGTILAEEVTHQRGDLVAPLRVLLGVHPFEKSPKRHGELVCLGLRCARHVIASPF